MKGRVALMSAVLGLAAAQGWAGDAVMSSSTSTADVTEPAPEPEPSKLKLSYEFDGDTSYVGGARSDFGRSGSGTLTPEERTRGHFVISAAV